MSSHSLARPAVRLLPIVTAGKRNACARSIANRRRPLATACSCSCSRSQQAHFHRFPPARLKFQLPFLGSSQRSSRDQDPAIVWCRNSSRGENSRAGVPGGGGCDLAVVLLGWLGAQQRHLRKYAEWYNSRGIDALAFAMPMRDLVSIAVMEIADRHVEELYREIVGWLSKSDGTNGCKEKSVLFHTFSNTGWFFYGAILEKLQQREQHHLLSRIKGCVVDSGPAVELSPQVWASGFATALLKKQSFSTKSVAGLSDAERALLAQPSMSETLLLALLEKFFAMLLSVPAVKSRLSDVVSILSSKQPPCPQLYIYSSADRVIPSSCVEDFMDLQRRIGYKVSSFNMRLSPHVDHLRSFPALYHEQLHKFVHEILSEKSIFTVEEAS